MDDTLTFAVTYSLDGANGAKCLFQAVRGRESTHQTEASLIFGKVRKPWQGLPRISYACLGSNSAVKHT